MNMGAQIGGAVTASLTPWIALRFGWTSSFLAAALLGVAGAIAGWEWILNASLGEDSAHAADTQTRVSPRPDEIVLRHAIGARRILLHLCHQCGEWRQHNVRR